MQLPAIEHITVEDKKIPRINTESMRGIYVIACLISSSIRLS